MKEYGEIFTDRVFTNDEIKKLQGEERSGKEKENVIDGGEMYNSYKKSRKNIKVKESDYKNIKEKLNDIFRKYHRKLEKGEISTLEEFYDMMMISFVLYEHLERISADENGENKGLEEFKEKIRKYNELKAERRKYDGYKDIYATDEEIARDEAETRKIDVQTDTVRKEITQFVNVMLSDLWNDYEKFRGFIQKDENLKILGELAELNSSFEKLNEIDIFENRIDIRNKLEKYFEEIGQFDFSLSGENDFSDNIESILNTLHKENDVINLMEHFVYANVLIRSNIMKFPLISEEYNKNSSIMEEIKALKYDVLNYYRNSLTYRENIRIDDEIMEDYSDVLFYDLLYLQHNRENTEKNQFVTFDNLESTKETYKSDLKIGNRGIVINGDNVTINCNINDFIQISNALELINKLKEENIQKDFTEFLYKDDEYYENRKFRLKGKFMLERENTLRKIENLNEIERKLGEKGMKLISPERRLLFSLFEKAEDETEDFKLDMIELLEEPFFVEKLIKAESVEENQAYSELRRKIIGGEENGKEAL